MNEADQLLKIRLPRMLKFHLPKTKSGMPIERERTNRLKIMRRAASPGGILINIPMW